MIVMVRCMHMNMLTMGVMMVGDIMREHRQFLGVGGAETILSRMCRADTANRHCVISLSGDGNYGPILRDAGIAVHSLAEPSGRLTLGGLLALRRLLKEIHLGAHSV